MEVVRKHRVKVRKKVSTLPRDEQVKREDTNVAESLRYAGKELQ